MNIRDLEYLIAFAHEGSFTKAAAKMNVSQPTLSTQIRKLEETLGTELIERSCGKQILTPAGRETVYYAKRIQSDAARIRQVGKRCADPWSSTLILGVFPTLCPYLLPRIMPVIRRYRPNLTVRFTEEKSARLEELLDSGQVDAAILSSPLPSPAIKTKHLFDEDFLLAASADSSFAQSEAAVDPSDLLSKRVLLLEDGHCMRRNMLEVCRRFRAVPAQFHATSLETLRYMVVGSPDTTLLPRLSTLPPIAQPAGLVLREFTPPKPYRSLFLNWRAASPIDTVMTGLGQLIATSCADLHR